VTASLAPSSASTHTGSPIAARLSALRAHMAQRGWQAVLLPSSDPHLSEYLPERWQGRAHFSGFTGSSGTLLVAADRAALFTDSRYWTQAEAQIAGSGIQLEKMATGASTNYIDWIAQQLQPGQVLAVDGGFDAMGVGLPTLRRNASA